MQPPAEPSTDFVFHVSNQHGSGCGAPPAVVNNDRDYYCGYFENAYGEQWVLLYNHQTQQATLRGGDIGWEREVPVVNGKPTGIVLNNHERLWLESCLQACGVSKPEFKGDFDPERN